MTILLSTVKLAIGYAGRRRAVPSTPVAHAIDLALRAGEFACLIGPNGAGKSTLLRTLAGMQKPLAGTVQLHLSPNLSPKLSANLSPAQPLNLHHLPPAELARSLAVVLTERVEVGNLSVFTLVGLGRHPYTDWRGRIGAQDAAIIERALTQVGALALAQRAVNELSDGERQRVMIARALAQEPRLLILDEPTAFLDLPRRVEMMQLLARLARETQCAVLLSTHDLDLALRIANTLWLLPVGGPLQTGLPEELVLNGALARTFASAGVEFDVASGAFKLQRHSCGPIGLTGEGSAAEWTGRALERIGYVVLRNPASGQAPATVNVVTDGTASRWEVIWADQKEEFATLGALVQRVLSP